MKRSLCFLISFFVLFAVALPVMGDSAVLFSAPTAFAEDLLVDVYSYNDDDGEPEFYTAEKAGEIPKPVEGFVVIKVGSYLRCDIMVSGLAADTLVASASFTLDYDESILTLEKTSNDFEFYSMGEKWTFNDSEGEDKHKGTARGLLP